MTLSLRRGTVLLALAAGSGCGYTLGHRVPPGVRTVSVPIFENATFPLRREVEFEVSSAFRREIQARTDLRIVDEDGSPDLVIRGRILEFRERVIAEGRRDVKTESNLLSLVELRIENSREGTLRLERVSDVEPFSIERGESFETGRRRAIQNIAEKLVVAMEDWGGDEPLEPDGATAAPAAADPPGEGDRFDRGGGGADGAAPGNVRGATIHSRRGLEGWGNVRSLERT